MEVQWTEDTKNRLESVLDLLKHSALCERDYGRAEVSLPV